MTIETILSIVSVALGAAGIVYAILTNRAKTRLEQYIQRHLRSLAGNIEWITASAAWAGQHFQAINETALRLERSEDVNQILTHAHDGRGDAIAAERMIKNLLNEALAIQEGQFGTRCIVHPGRPED